MTKVINLYGGPGTGKSTTMALTFAAMKMRGYSVEMAPEWVKIPVWAGNTSVLEDQLYILAKQHHILKQLDGGPDWVVTDAPLLVTLVYSEFEAVCQAARHHAAQYDNFHVFLDRVKPYFSGGRVQDEERAHSLDDQFRQMLRDEGVVFTAVSADEHAGKHIMDYLGLE